MTQFTRRVTPRQPRTIRAALLTCSLALWAPDAGAQEVRIFRAPGADHSVIVRADADRPMIGVTTAAESERADTLGLRIDDVRAGSPAEKAGLKAGDRLQAVNGVSLRADRADAGESDYSGVLNRRLQRAVQAAKPGEAVTLRVLSGGTTREVRITPVKASDLEPEATPFGIRMRGASADRAVLGLDVASTGSVRDTLGVFVRSVVSGGPAEKAGIIEGDRIAAINGVSLRVAREDAEDEAVGSARAERLSREVAKLSAGDAVELTVVTAGRSRSVRVTTVKAGDLPASERGIFMVPPDMSGLRRKMPFDNGMPEVRIQTRPTPEVRMLQRRVPEVRLRERSVAPLATRRSIRTMI
jgi:serine protease Do